MKTYVISLVILVLSGTNALAANSSSFSIERHDLEVSDSDPTTQVVSDKTNQGSAAVGDPKPTLMMLASKLGDTHRGSPDSRPPDKSE
ncbi:MAG: hypothetical protein F6K41_36900 [Symploca sp. SIO3E6]|nr:hypothetical protein [Caldora sp. SIO3E6]